MLITKSLQQQLGSGEAALTNLSCLSIPDETDCKTSSTSLTDLDKADWQDNKLYYLAGNLNNQTFVIITSILFQFQLSLILNSIQKKYFFKHSCFRIFIMKNIHLLKHLKFILDWFNMKLKRPCYFWNNTKKKDE